MLRWRRRSSASLKAVRHPDGAPARANAPNLVARRVLMAGRHVLRRRAPGCRRRTAPPRGAGGPRRAARGLVGRGPVPAAARPEGTGGVPRVRRPGERLRVSALRGLRPPPTGDLRLQGPQFLSEVRRPSGGRVLGVVDRPRGPSRRDATMGGDGTLEAPVAARAASRAGERRPDRGAPDHRAGVRRGGRTASTPTVPTTAAPSAASCRTPRTSSASWSASLSKP